MEHLTSIASWRTFARAQREAGRSVGLVATMGALHEGHASLVAEARSRGDVVLLTSFVNPRQFADPADLANYPLTPDADAALAERAGVAALVTPSVDEMWPDYPSPTATVVSVKGLGDVLEGADRPGHFDGVASVVAKLFAVTGPCRAYFGDKDFQQLAVVRAMTRDIGFDVEVVGCRIVRDARGMALSSRNRRLSPDGYERALALHAALSAVGAQVDTARALEATMHSVLEASGVDIAYASVVDPVNLLTAPDDATGYYRAVIAGYVEGVRLLDNAMVRVRSSGATGN